MLQKISSTFMMIMLIEANKDFNHVKKPMKKSLLDMVYYLNEFLLSLKTKYESMDVQLPKGIHIVWFFCLTILVYIILRSLIRAYRRYTRLQKWKSDLHIPGLYRYTNWNELAKPNEETLKILKVSTRRLESDFELPHDCIGSGTSGMVYLRHDVHRQAAFVALKIFHVSSSFAQVEHALLEIKTQHTIAAPSVVKVLGYVYDLQEDGNGVDCLGMIMEYCSNGNLEEYITLEGKCMEEVQIWDWCRDVATALHALHTAGVINADVKSANVVLTDDMQARLVDFGASVKCAHAGDNVTGFFGTEEYDPPEVSHQLCDNIDVQFNTKVDIWGLGCILYEMMTGKLLDVTLSKTPLRKVLQEIPERYSAYSISLLEWCLAHAPSKRATAAQVMQYLSNTPSQTTSLLHPVHLLDKMENVPDNIKRQSRVRTKRVTASKTLRRRTSSAKNSPSVNRTSPRRSAVSSSPTRSKMPALLPMVTTFSPPPRTISPLDKCSPPRKAYPTTRTLSEAQEPATMPSPSPEVEKSVKLSTPTQTTSVVQSKRKKEPLLVRRSKRLAKQTTQAV